MLVAMLVMAQAGLVLPGLKLNIFDGWDLVMSSLGLLTVCSPEM